MDVISKAGQTAFSEVEIIVKEWGELCSVEKTLIVSGAGQTEGQ